MNIPCHIAFSYRGQEWSHDFEVAMGSPVLALKGKMTQPDGTKADADSFELQLRGRRLADYEPIVQEVTLDFVFLGPEEGCKKAAVDAEAKATYDKAREEERLRQDWRRRQAESQEEQRQREAAEREAVPVGEVEVTVTHALNESQATVKVMSNCKVLDVRRAVLAAVGEKKLSEVKLVRKQGGYLIPLKDESDIGERREFLSMGRSLQAKEAEASADDHWLKIVSMQDWAERWLQVTAPGMTIKEVKQRLCEEVQRGPAGQVKLQVNGSPLKDADKVEKIPQGEWHNLVAEGIELGPPHEVDVKVTHCSAQHFVWVSLLDTATVADLRQAVSEKTTGSTADVRIVRRLGHNSFQSLADADRLNGQTEFLCMGKALEERPRGALQLTAPVFPDRDVVVSVCLDRDMGFAQEVTVKLGSSVRSLKEELAAGDPTHQTKPEDFGLCLSSAPDRHLADSVLITEEHLRLDLVPGGGEAESPDAPTGFVWTWKGTLAVRGQDKFGKLKSGDPFTTSHLNMIREDPNFSWVDLPYLAAEDLIKDGQMVQVTLKHALNETRTTVSVSTSASILELRRAVMLAIGQTKLSELKIVDDNFEPLEDGATLDGRTRFYTVGCALG